MFATDPKVRPKIANYTPMMSYFPALPLLSGWPSPLTSLEPVLSSQPDAYALLASKKELRVKTWNLLTAV